MAAPLAVEFGKVQENTLATETKLITRYHMR